MGSPEAIRAWITDHGGLSNIRGLYRPGLPDSPLDTLSAASQLIPVAFVGRVSGDELQDPVGSLLRQLRVAQAALPEGCEIMAFFYDVESGRKDLDARGLGHTHERFAIPIPRDGSIQDLLAEATGPGCRFQAVICEQIDRIARRTYFGVLIEHQLQSAGIGLWAADEPIAVEHDAIIDPTSILTRRVKQGVAEWYALDMIKRARDGFEIHTEQGYNVGKPCYGFRAVTVRLDQRPHPQPCPDPQDTACEPGPRRGHRGKGRAGPRTKTKLVIDSVEAAVVQKIYHWRITERLSYQAIADRLNQDLTVNPAPTPPDPDRAVGSWTPGSVRDVLTQPKYTGYMVWNRRAMKTRRGSPNPIDKWVWSSQPTHEAIISLETFISAQQVVRRRERSRTQPGANTRHPHTKRSYLLRSYLFCALCGRRMFGKTRRECAYYACAPKKGYVPDAHPDSLWIRETGLLNSLHDFLTHHVFGPYRHTLLAATQQDIDRKAEQTRAHRIAAIKKTIADNDARCKRLIQALEITDDLDTDFIRDINNRRAHMKAENARLQAELDHLDQQVHEQPNPELLQALPIGSCDLADLPEDIARRLFEALRLEIHYDKLSNTALCRITLTGETIPAVQRATNDSVVVPFPPRPTPTDQLEDTTERSPAPVAPLFPSVTCPRQDSNLRIADWLVVETTVILSASRCDGPDVLTVGRLRELGERLGVDFDDRSVVLGLAAVGAVKIAWRDSPVEDWHAGPDSRIRDSEMMRANAAMTRLVREVFHAHGAAAGRPLSASGSSGSEPVRMFGEVCSLIGDPQRRLPDGRTLAEVAPDEDALELFVVHVRACGRRWMKLARSQSVEAVLLALAVLGAQRCWHWWLGPGWPALVEEFILCLQCPTRWYDPAIIAAVTRVPRPLTLAEDDRLRRELEAGPDLLSAEHAAYCIQAGLQAVVRTHARALYRDEWIRLAELLEPGPRRRLPPRSAGQGQS